MSTLITHNEDLFDHSLLTLYNVCVSNALIVRPMQKSKVNVFQYFCEGDYVFANSPLFIRVRL